MIDLSNTSELEKLQQMGKAMREMIVLNEEELSALSKMIWIKKYKRHDLLSIPGQIPQEVFFVNNGIVRVIVTDPKGIEHTTHFAFENQFIADYANFIQQKEGIYTLQALEDTEVIVLPRKMIDWGYEHLREGQKLGRLIAEYYFIYQDERIQNLYSRTAQERYQGISRVFPTIHDRVPQHMIASYLGITPVHLSRLKKKLWKSHD
jgi:CRP-like cAMP-binding protein